MLQGSGAMPTLVVEEGPVPFASGETPTATETLRRALCSTPKPTASLPRWRCGTQWNHFRDSSGAPLHPHPWPPG